MYLYGRGKMGCILLAGGKAGVDISAQASMVDFA